MSLSITVNNINDLTDTERAVLRYVLDGVPLTDELREHRVALTGPTVAQRFIEAMAAGESFEGKHGTFRPAAPVAPIRTILAGCGHPVSEDGRLACDKCSADAVSQVASATALRAPAAPIHASATAGTGAELDSAGLPWDKRIHSSGRTKLQDGTWRKLKGLDDTLVATVEAELRAVQAIPVPVLLNHGGADAVPIPVASTYIGDGSGIHAVGTEVIPGVNADPSVVPPVGCNPVPVPPAAVPAPPAPTATVAEMQAKLDAAGVPAPLTFADLMKHVTPMLVGGKLSQDKLLAVTAEFGLPHLAALGARPDLVEAVRARIDEVVG